jgi:hypothetical protein
MRAGLLRRERLLLLAELVRVAFGRPLRADLVEQRRG